MRLALIQMDILWQKREDNLKRALFFIEKTGGQSCDLVVFPEMFDTGFFPEIQVIDEGSRTDSLLSDAAKRYGINTIAGLAVKEKGEERARNIARVYDRTGRCIAEYTKIYPFSFMDEDRFFIAGTEPIIFEIDGIPSSIFICYDLRFPEIFRKVARKVHLIFVIASWPSSRVDHWKTLLKARAIENQCFIIGVNRTGRDGKGISFLGASSVYSPSGELIIEGDNREELLIAEIDPSQVHKVRREFPFLKDMK